MNIIILTLALFLTQLTGCVEVKDANDSPVAVTKEVPPTATAASYANLEVDRPLYLYRGEVLSEPEFNAEYSRLPPEYEPDQYDYHFNKISFSGGGVLYTYGSIVRIYAETLTSDLGQISTYPSGTTAPDFLDGMSGGHIILKVKSATGLLRINMRGEIGGKGLPPRLPDAAIKGPRGLSVLEAANHNFSRNENEPYRYPWGLPGLQGYPANPGRPGGNSGTLEIEIALPSDFDPQIVKEAGAGGIPGDPGIGGEGGDPGQGETAAWGPVQVPPRGPAGNPSVPGPSGLKEYSCVLRGAERTCREN